MSEHDEHDEEREWLLSELDWDDMVEAFVGSLAALILVLVVLALVTPRRRRRLV